MVGFIESLAKRAVLLYVNSLIVSVIIIAGIGKSFKLTLQRSPPREAKQFIESKYIHKKSGNVYRVRNYAICKDRDIAVVIYSDLQGNLYTRSEKDFKATFTPAQKEQRCQE